MFPTGLFLQRERIVLPHNVVLDGSQQSDTTLLDFISTGDELYGNESGGGYGYRIRRNSGTNGNTVHVHRGTGFFLIQFPDSAGSVGANKVLVGPYGLACVERASVAASSGGYYQAATCSNYNVVSMTLTEDTKLRLPTLSVAGESCSLTFLITNAAAAKAFNLYDYGADTQTNIVNVGTAIAAPAASKSILIVATSINGSKWMTNMIWKEA